MNPTRIIKIPAAALRAAYQLLPPEGEVIICCQKGIIFPEEHLEGVHFFAPSGKVVKPQLNPKRMFHFHRGYVVKKDTDTPRPRIVFVFIVGLKEGTNEQ